jgi:drug/metabolite transporter (DMT)-like permease/ADP-ribose pyrophosphatase YjhB (NUDIX family)
MRFLLADGLGPMVLLASRLGIAGLAAGAWGALDLKRQRVARADVPLLLVFGLLVLPVSYGAFLWSVTVLPVGVAVMLNYTAPVYTVLCAVPLFGERLGVPRVLAMVLAVAGCVLMAGMGVGLGGGRLTAGAVAVGLLAGASYAVNILAAKLAVGRIGARALASWGIFLAGAELCIIEARNLHTLAVLDATGWVMLLGIGVVGVVVANTLYFMGLERVDAGQASIITTVEPLCAVLFAYVFLREHLSALQLVGGAMIVAGAVLSQGGGPGGPRRGFRREFSAGGVLFRGRGGGAEVLMIRDRFGRWSFPKGVVEAGETPAQAATREVLEECGVTGVVLGDLGRTAYWYTHPGGDRVRKQVTYFLMGHVAGEPAPRRGEVDDAAWVTGDEVLARSAYPSHRQLVERALAAIRARGRENHD